MHGLDAAQPGFGEKDLTGFKFFKVILPMLRRLHDQGCKRDKARNRTLFFDSYASFVLLYFFNPIVRRRKGVAKKKRGHYSLIYLLLSAFRRTHIDANNE
jgi:hypothetical protein